MIQEFVLLYRLNFIVGKVAAVPVVRSELLVNNVRMCPAKY